MEDNQHPNRCLMLQVAKVAVQSLPKLCVSGFLIYDIKKTAAEIANANAVATFVEAMSVAVPGVGTRIKDTLLHFPWLKIAKGILTSNPVASIFDAISELQGIKNKEAAQELAKQVAKAARKAEEAARLAREETERKQANTLITAATLVGFVADITQARCECTGLDTPGRIVGAVGNIIYGAMVGYAVAGIKGAIAGAALGWLLWGVGQLIRRSSS